MMKEDSLAVEYLSAGANRQTAVADWSEDGIVAFGADSNIALWRPHDPAQRGVTSLLSGHKEVVKAVKFLPKLAGDTQSYLLSGADDHCLKIWTIAPNGAAECVQTVQHHTAAVNCIATLYQRGSPDSSSRIFATGAADASIKVWIFDGTEARLLQTIKPSPKFFPLAIALSKIDEESGGLVLAAAGTRDIIQVFAADSGTSPEFHLQATLSGHEGWIRSLDFTRESRDADADLILASASQDKYIRLWRFHQGKELPAAASADPSMGAFMPGKSPSNKAHRLKVAGRDFSVTFEALLLGHDDWIYSAKWCSSPAAGGQRLLSTSADNTLAIWEADPSSGIWLTTVRLGEISREKGATTATGSTGGFWTGLWSPDGTSVTCLGRTGSWRLWDYSKDEDQWIPQIGISGHTRAVTGVAWSKNGDYLLSTSSDQTTRLHASWNRGPDVRTWHEMARPQIHGYDLNCIDSLGGSRFVSGADEKLMRVFDEPKSAARLLSRLCGIGGGEDDPQIDSMPDAANMPVLGLSNKAVEAVDDDQEVAPAANPETATDREALLDPGTTVRKSALLDAGDRPPLEDSLSRHTLWPEAEKLYGHGYEISCLAASHDGRLIASACRASSVNHAVIRLFETGRWTEVRPPLAAHSLTATRLRFSPPDDRFLLSVGRDRQWAVFQRVEDADPADPADPAAGDHKRTSYRLAQSDPKGHSRMILDAAWAPGRSLVFATAGRDKQVKIWRGGGGGGGGEGEGSPGGSPAAGLGISCVTMIPETHPVTAIDFLQRDGTDGGDNDGSTLILAVGTEAGKISIYSIDSSSLAVVSCLNLKPEFCLARAVLQLAWRPQSALNELAIAGEDGSLRVYSFTEQER
ncbi:RNA polymerase II Elongator subunit [Biscogniauxia marginata]|nr:RNA polymerase II Elongator subunit [Biscogniauxia marginata]